MVFNRKQSRALGTGAAFAGLALAACSGGGKSTPSITATPIATITPLVGASTSPAPAAIGVAYLPDGGNGQGFTGLQVVHFENTLSQLLATNATGVPQQIAFPGAVGPFEISVGGLSAIAAVSKTQSPPYTLVQEVFGTNASATVPVGTGYDVTVVPTTAPNATPVAQPTTIPSPLPVLSQVQSLGIYGDGTTSQIVGVAAGPDTTGFLGITQLNDAGPAYGGFVPFAGQTPEPLTVPRPHIVALKTTNVSEALLRGSADLLVYEIAVGGSGYTFSLRSQSTSFGLGQAALGPGVMAIDPNDGSRAVIGQTNPGDGSVEGVTLVTGLPGAITAASTISVGSVPRSIAITSGGGYAVVGTDAGFVVLSGIGSGTLVLRNAFAPASTTTSMNAPSYTGCDGKTYSLANVDSVGFSADLAYLAVLGNQPSAACAGGRTASLVVMPFNQTLGTAPTAAPSPSGTATAAPTMFVQNNVIAPSAGQDYMFVR